MIKRRVRLWKEDFVAGTGDEVTQFVTSLTNENLV